MSILNQKTINKKIVLSGVGLHTGKLVELNLYPLLLIQELYLKELILRITILSYQHLIM